MTEMRGRHSRESVRPSQPDFLQTAREFALGWDGVVRVGQANGWFGNIIGSVGHFRNKRAGAGY